MSKLVPVLMVFMVTCQAHAFFVPILNCQSQSKTYSLEIKQDGGDITLVLGNRKPYSVGQVGGKKPGSKKYRISTTMNNSFIIHSRMLAEFYHSGDAQELVAGLMYQRPEFDGDQDLVHGYASDLVHGLICR